ASRPRAGPWYSPSARSEARSLFGSAQATAHAPQPPARTGSFRGAKVATAALESSARGERGSDEATAGRVPRARAPHAGAGSRADRLAGDRRGGVAPRGAAGG